MNYGPMLQSAATNFLIAGGGGAAIAYAVFRFFGEKWIEDKFNSRLQTLRHDHDREIEKLKYQISGLLDRATKRNQREFETLPEAWAKVHEAFAQAHRLTTRFRTVPDFFKLSDAATHEQLEKSRLSQWERDELLALSKNNRTDYWSKAMYWYELHDAKSAMAEAFNYLFKNGILISPEIHKKLSGFADFIHTAIAAHEVNREVGGPIADDDPAEVFRNVGAEKRAALEAELREHFWAPAEVDLSAG